MAFCKNCGAQLDSGAKFCPNCGSEQEIAQTAQSAPIDEAYNSIEVLDQPAAPQAPKSSGSYNVLQLVWSIINLIACCMPLGIASLILTVLAKDAPTAEEEAKKLKTAKICNIIGTVSAVIAYIIYIVAYVFILIGVAGAA